MTNERKLRVFDNLCGWIAETCEGLYDPDEKSYEEYVKEQFLDLGFTEEEYEEEMEL